MVLIGAPVFPEFQDSKACFGQSTSASSVPAGSSLFSTGSLPGPSSPFESNAPFCGGQSSLSESNSPCFGVPSTSGAFPSSNICFGQSSTCSAGHTLFGGATSSAPAMGASTCFNKSSHSGSSSFFGAGQQFTNNTAGHTGFGNASPFSSCFGVSRGNTCGSIGPTDNNQCRGTSIVSYTAITDMQDPFQTMMMQSISAMPCYRYKSHEELRWEDYQLNNKGKPRPLEPFSFPTLANPSTATPVFGLPKSNLFSSSFTNLSVPQSQGFVFPSTTTNISILTEDLPSNPFLPPSEGFAASAYQGFTSSSVPAQVGQFAAFTQQKPPYNFQSSNTSTTATASATSLSPQAPVLNASQAGQVTTTNPSQPPHGASFRVNVNSIEVDEVSELMLKLPHGDYYTEPSIEELEARERAFPGYCSRVTDFVVGRKDKGTVKFLGEVDIRQLDLESVVQFNEGEVIMYLNGAKKPPIGQGLNRPAEITLLNVKCVSKATGHQYTNGHLVKRFEKKLVEKAGEVGAEFVSYDPHRGEWKFQVQHF